MSALVAARPKSLEVGIAGGMAMFWGSRHRHLHRRFVLPVNAARYVVCIGLTGFFSGGVAYAQGLLNCSQGVNCRDLFGVEARKGCGS